MNWKYVFNPFMKYPEKTLLVFGVCMFFAGSGIAGYYNLNYDGIFDIHASARQSFLRAISQNAINVSILFILLYVLAKLLNPRTRAIDILNTTLLYRVPLYIAAIFVAQPCMAPIAQKILSQKELLTSNLSTAEMATLLVISFISLTCLAWAITLCTNGFRTSANIKKWQQFLLFAFALLVAEFLSKQLIIKFFV